MENFPLKLAFYNSTPLAGMPWRTMKVCNRVLKQEGGWARSILGRSSYGGKKVFPHDLLASDPEAADVLREADLIILSSYGRLPNGTDPDVPYARHYSTEVFRWKDRMPNPLRSTVVAQYQARFALGCDVLPNCMPIDDPIYTPGEKPTDRVVIVYAPSNRSPRGGRNPWGSKGYPETIEQLRKLSVQYKERVEILVLENRSHLEVMKAKRHAHIVIDECVTGSYHSNSLEGLSCGAVTIAHIDGDTEIAFRRLFGDDAETIELPFLSTTVFHLKATIETLVTNPDLLLMMGKANREWMLKHYSENWQAAKWINWHRTCLQNSRSSSNA